MLFWNWPEVNNEWDSLHKSKNLYTCFCVNRKIYNLKLQMIKMNGSNHKSFHIDILFSAFLRKQLLFVETLKLIYQIREN
jgi:hypothetical protein